MKLLTVAQHATLVANGERSLADQNFDPPPVVKLFTPDAACTWLLSEIDPHNVDRAFGLCDAGLGCPELGWVALSALARLRGRLGLPVERDRHWRASRPLSAYAAEAHRSGRIEA
jgi:hypothetical protein